MPRAAASSGTASTSRARSARVASRSRIREPSSSEDETFSQSSGSEWSANVTSTVSRGGRGARRGGGRGAGRRAPSMRALNALVEAVAPAAALLPPPAPPETGARTPQTPPGVDAVINAVVRRAPRAPRRPLQTARRGARAPVPARHQLATRAGRPSVGRGGTVAAAAPANSPAAARAPAPPPMNHALNRSVNNRVNLECIVCLENLDSAATVMEEPGNEVQEGAGDEQRQMLVNDFAAIMGYPGGIRNPFYGPQGPIIPPNVNGRIRVGRGGVVLADIDPREIAATPCGHMYHKYCIER
jgi:hypothetical protein